MLLLMFDSADFSLFPSLSTLVLLFGDANIREGMTTKKMSFPMGWVGGEEKTKRKKQQKRKKTGKKNKVSAVLVSYDDGNQKNKQTK